MRASKAKPSGEISAVRGKLITVGDASKITGLGKDWFYRHMETATLPFPWYRLSVGKRAIDSEDLNDWLMALKVPVGKLPGEKKGARMD
jgi:predicted DNA-binding transcriptional regulator AlpA